MPVTEKPPTKVVTVQFERSVVHSHVYSNKPEGLAGIYLPKLWFAEMGLKHPPTKLTLTLEVQND